MNEVKPRIDVLAANLVDAVQELEGQIVRLEEATAEQNAARSAVMNGQKKMEAARNELARALDELLPSKQRGEAMRSLP